jgi:hypothetical protein
MSWWQWLLVSLAVVLGFYAAFVAWLVILGRRDEAHALATFIPSQMTAISGSPSRWTGSPQSASTRNERAVR